MFKKILEEEHLAKFKSDLNTEVYSDTKYYQKIYNFKIGEKGEHDTWNNEADAFKHTFGSAWSLLKYNKITSFSIGYLHELEGRYDNNQSKEEEIMDTHNNKEGRKIAEEIKKYYPNWKKMPERRLKDIIAKKVMQKMDNGILIKSPNEVKKHEQEAMVRKFLKMYIDYHNQKMNDYFKNIINEFYLKYSAPAQQNLKSQGKPQNMNFGELIRQPQVLAPQTLALQNGQFNTSQTAITDNALKYNYGKNKTIYNTMPIQNEKNPTLYKGAAIKPQALSISGGQSVLNSADNTSIPQVKYSNLPEFEPLNVALNTSSAYNFDDVPDYITGNDTLSNLTGGNIDMSSVVYLTMMLLDMYQARKEWRPTVKKSGDVNTGDTTNSEQNSDTPQQTQYYEFIPSEYL